MTKGHGRDEAKPAKPPYKRQQYWVDAPLQLQMVGFVVLLVASSLLLSAFSVYKGVHEASVSSRQIFHSLEWIKESLRAPLMLASAISLLASGLITLFWSHRFAGPLRVISAGIARVRHGNLGVAVRVRDTDAHQELAKEFQLMQDGLRDMIAADRGHIANALAHLDKAASHAHGETKDELEKAQAELKKACAKYHL
jgi:nitrogen fixation/metabolism regulation signal transduction histidine kinase